MTMPGETLATGAPAVCPECGHHVELQVHRGGAGFYVGSWCECGPYTRESGYYRSRAAAELALKLGAYSR